MQFALFSLPLSSDCKWEMTSGGNLVQRWAIILAASKASCGKISAIKIAQWRDAPKRRMPPSFVVLHLLTDDSHQLLDVQCSVEQNTILLFEMAVERFHGRVLLDPTL